MHIFIGKQCTFSKKKGKLYLESGQQINGNRSSISYFRGDYTC